MLKKLGVNVVSVFCCVVSLSAIGVVNCPPLAGVGGGFMPQAEAQGVDAFAKLMLHADGSDQGTSFTDSSATPKTVTNTESYDSYTKLMLHIEGSDGSTTFTDSATGKSVTTSGNAQIDTAQSKLGTASGLFDAYPDRLQSADSNDWSFGTGDFTVDFWVRFSSFAGESQQHFVSQYDASYPNTYWSIHYSVSGALNMHFYDGVLKGSYRTNVVLNTNTWYHLAFERYGSGAKIFVNGVSQTLVEDNAFGTNDVGNANAPLSIGDRAGWGYILRGWIDELRISKGIARWTSDFTPPSSPYGKVATVTSQKKFGTASGEFKGSGEYLSLADSDDWNFGSGDFTIDFWVYLNSLSSVATIVEQELQFPSWTENTYYRLTVGTAGDLDFISYNNAAYVGRAYTSSGLITTGQWYHIAFVRKDSVYKYYVNGTGITTTNEVQATLPDVNGDLRLGCARLSGYFWYFLNGYIDEFRISKGIARWTSNFTPPSAPYETDTTSPTVSSTSPTSNATGVGVSSAISATFSEDVDSSTITTSTFTLSSSGSSVSGTLSYSNKVATFTPSSNLSYATTYTATITTGVKDISGNAMSSTYTWSFTTSSAPDTTAPTGSVSGASYTNSSTVTLTLSATDSVGVTGYYLSDSSTIPSSSASGWTSVTSTTSYSGTVSYSLTSGEGSKTIYAWYKDVAGNVSSTSNATITYDTTVPTVTISSPTSSSTYTATSGTISLGGSASDSTSGISSVAWSNNRGGNGTATGTASWTVSSISLSSGDNVITVTAKDGANNSGTDTLQVTYGTSSTVSAPTVSTGSAASVTTSSATLNGTVNANGASTTAWFQYGSTSGSYGNTSSTQTVTGSSNTTVSIGISGLSSNTKYYYRIAASNSGGTSYGGESSFTTSTASATPTPTPTPSTGDTIAPTVTITSPTSSSTYTTTSSAITLSGTASDNSGSVSSVTWSNSKGGGGTASGTTSWTISGISLSAGDNVITVTATDGSGNFGTDSLQVTYHVTTTPTPTAAPTATTTPKPSPTAQPTPARPPTLPPLPTPIPQVSPTATPSGGSGSVSGNVDDNDGNALEGVTVTIERVLLAALQRNISVQAATLNQREVAIVGANGSSPSEKSTETDENGYYEFSGLAKGVYTLTYEKDGYQTLTKKVSLGEGEAKDLGTTVLEEEEVLGGIYGNVVDIKGNPIESVKVRLKGIKTKVTSTETSDADGYYEFTGLGEDTYIITAKKKRYRKFKQTVTLGEGEQKEVEIELRKTTKKIKGLLLEGEVK